MANSTETTAQQDPSYGGATTADLLKQIQLQAGSNTELRNALLWGAYGESTDHPTAQGSGGGGAFGFTPLPGETWDEMLARYGLTPTSIYEAGPDVTAAINSLYSGGVAGQGAGGPVPSNLSGLAQAEWIAISSEKPEYDIAELQQIASSGEPLTASGNSYYGYTYGANTDPTIGEMVAQQIQAMGGGEVGSGTGTGTGDTSLTGTTGTTGTQSFSPAGNVIGQIAQQIDAFLNPTDSLLGGPVGSIIGDITGLNSAWQAIIQLVDRGITIVGGIGLIILGGYIASRPGKASGTGALRQGVRSYTRGTATGLAQATAYERRLQLRNQYASQRPQRAQRPLRWASRAGETGTYGTPGAGGENVPFSPADIPGGGPGAKTPASAVLGLPRGAGKPARRGGGTPARQRPRVTVTLRRMGTALPAGEAGEARVIETTARQIGRRKAE
jgi:hypothetical protein